MKRRRHELMQKRNVSAGTSDFSAGLDWPGVFSVPEVEFVVV